MTLNSEIGVMRVISPNALDREANYVKLIAARPILSEKNVAESRLF